MVQYSRKITKLSEYMHRIWTSQVAQRVKNAPAMQETWVSPLGWERCPAMPHGRRAWQSIKVFSPGESHGQRHLAGYGPWSHKESDTTEANHACILALS